MSLLLLVLVSLFSCSKDADLLSEYVIASDNDLESIALLLDDNFFMAPGQDAIVMDVLNNDTFSPDADVAIVGTSTPSNGDVTINEDNTLTYTPNTEEESTEEPVEDNFTYTTEVTTEDNTTYREEATVTISSSDMGELLAFPSAQGFGKYTTGGRGGKVIHVTNLNDSGSGSLRNAIEQKGARTIVFDVGGDIYLTSTQLNIGSSNGDLTIAGETAPFPGITIRGDKISSASFGATINISGSNVIIRYISVRENNNNKTDNDAIRLRNDVGMNNIIIDHVSMSNGSDENFSVQGVSDVTIQNCMITNTDTNYTFLFGIKNYNFTFIGNYISHSVERNILVGYGLNGETSEWINNIVYGYEGGMNMVYGNNLDVLGNIYKAFINNTPDYTTIEWNPNQYNNPNGSITDGSFYLSDNHQLNPHQYGLYNSRALDYQNSSRVITNSTISTWATSVQDIEARVFGDKLPGNSLYQDSMDEQAISDYFNNTGSFGSLNVPNKESTSRPSDYDTDNDGMADAWERAMYGDLSKTANGDEDGDGYTNLEAFLYSLVQ
ncbi:hypothetical protein J8L85_14385 [Maribacter sp. MMG018]|uniref:Ig-like domain-containing protein n=1 Tax=Maribacter sp. MMG018 TaxID=2822688 RepID=UPI001B39AB50|nr:hypothetical protein [Maribacter sp. MMG018]